MRDIKITTIVRYCDNLVQMVHFYEEQLGMSFHIIDGGYAAKLGDVIFELRSRPTEQRLDENWKINSMMAFSTDDRGIDDIKINLKNNRGAYSATDSILAIRDPEGGVVVVEREP